MDLKPSCAICPRGFIELDFLEENNPEQGTVPMRKLLLFLLFFVPALGVHAGHKDLGVLGTTAYLFHSDPNSISRYDMNAEAWLAPVFLPLASTGTAMLIHDGQIYVSMGEHIYRLMRHSKL